MLLAARRALAAVPALVLFFSSACNSPDEVAAFCNTSVAALTSGQPVFADMEQSCLREVNSRPGFATFKPALESDPFCSEIGVQGQSALAAASLLSDYFSAIGSLASYGAAKAGSDAKRQVASASAGFGANSQVQTALGAIADFLVTAATSGYRQKSLDHDLSAVIKNVAAVTAALIRIVHDDYIGRQLKSEEQKLGIHYQEFAEHASAEGKLLLDERWHGEERALAAKRASARSLIVALQSISDGTTNLAAHAHSLRAKDVAGLLAPYIAKLQALLPAIRNAF